MPTRDTPSGGGGTIAPTGSAPTGLPGSPIEQDADVQAAMQAVTSAQSAEAAAERDYATAATAYDQLAAQSTAHAADLSYPNQVKAAGDRVLQAQKALSDARLAVADVQTKLSTAHTGAASRAKDPNLKQYYSSHSEQAQADAALAKAQADAVNAKTPSEIAQAQSAVTEATARAQSLGILTPAQVNQANSAATESMARANNINALTPSQVAVNTSQAGVNTATAANTSAQTTQLVPAQAKEALSRAGLNDAQTAEVLGKTPAEIDQLVAEGHLSQAQADLVKAQIPNTQAATAHTEAETQQLKLGGLFGLGDRINAMRDAIAQGRVTPDEANNELQQYINSQVQTATTGASQFDRNKAALEAETTRRQQDSSLAGTDASTYGSGFSSALGTFQKLNDTTPIGSDSAGKGFLASMEMLASRLKGFQPSTPTNSPLMQSMTAMPAAAPADTGASGHTITINIGGTGGAPAVTAPPENTPQTAQTPQTPAAPAQPQQDFGASSIGDPSRGPAFLQSKQPATAQDVQALWANDPHLNPSGASAAGAA